MADIDKCNTLVDLEKALFQRIKQILKTNPEVFSKDTDLLLFGQFSYLISAAKQELFEEQNKGAIEEYKQRLIRAVAKEGYNGTMVPIRELVSSFKNLLNDYDGSYPYTGRKILQEKLKEDESMLREILTCMAMASPTSLYFFLGTLLRAAFMMPDFTKKLKEEAETNKQEPVHDPAA